MPVFSHIIEEQINPSLRLDRYVSEVLSVLSRSQIKARNLKAKINGKDVKISRYVKNGDSLELTWDDSKPLDIIPQDIPLDIIHEDERCIVVNKAQGMVTHPGAGNRQGTFANALCFRRIRRGESESGSTRPGIVHRLDKDTSGVIIAAFDDEALMFLADQFKDRKTKKNYIAVVKGAPKEKKGRIETFIARDPKDRKRFTVSAAGRNAVTFYKIIKSWCVNSKDIYSLVLLRPRTGRTHQLRVHLRHINCPILGDPIYSAEDKLFSKVSLMLHSKSLAITLPGEANECVFSAPVPQRFREVMDKLNRMTKNE